MHKTRFLSIFEHILNWPTIAWVLIGFSVSYIYFFIYPIFLNSAHMMQFYEYVPAIDPIGSDLRNMLRYGELWFIEKRTPYHEWGNVTPPFASIFFTPLLAVDFSTAYAILTVINLASFSFMMVLLPLLISKEKRLSPILVLFFATGILSYGFQFELERGQSNVIAISFCFLSVYIYHLHHRFRYIAYMLLSVSIQLKVYPAIFVVMFVKDWSEWKNNLKRFGALLTFNFALLFILGTQVFTDFITSITERILNPFYWPGNHSITSFLWFFSGRLKRNPYLQEWAWLTEYNQLAQVMLLTFIVICLCLIIYKAYKTKTSGPNLYLLLACTIGAMLIPADSHDYKLSILAAPVAIVLTSTQLTKSNSLIRALSIILIVIISTAYSSTLFSYTNKTYFLVNNLPALLIILASTTLLSVLDRQPI